MALAFHLCPEELDRTRLETAICHDVAEVKVGDTPYDGISPEEKIAIETKAMLEISSKLPRGKEMLELYKEYEAGVSPEARFLKLCDKL